jgi:methanethiol S-methyltransferase
MDLSISLLIDFLLVLGFGLQHSWLATLRVKRTVKAKTKIEALAWRSVESLSNVVYVLIAASLWQHTPDHVVWQTSGLLMYVLYAVVVASWLWYWQLHLFEYDSGLAFGSTTLVSKLTNSPAPKLVPWKVGSRRWIRFPVHTAFFGMFLFLPTMTADLLLLGVVLNIYNVIGSILYDKRLLTLARDAYLPYVNVTGLIFPPVYRAPRGAADVRMPAPAHWRKPVMHLPGLIVGIGLGVLYWLVLGDSATTPLDMLMVALIGLAGAVVTGFLLGTVLKPQADAYEQVQTDVSTTVAVNAAVGVITWAILGWVHSGSAPSFAAFLPLWFIVQYLGHVFAVLADRTKWSAEGIKQRNEKQEKTGKFLPVSGSAEPATA